MILLIRVLTSLLLFFPNLHQSGHLQPGKERWSVKTSLAPHARNIRVPIDELLSLGNPISRNDKKYDTVRIPVEVGPRHLKEGDLVTTKAWLHLVALEDDSKTHRDGDYHIQVRSSPALGDSCLVIEVPLSEFIPDSSLAVACARVRMFVRDKLLQGKEPGTRGNLLNHAVLVTVTGQLFFDAPHLTGPPRGKQHMRSYTPWELHPVISMTFTPQHN